MSTGIIACKLCSHIILKCSGEICRDCSIKEKQQPTLIRHDLIKWIKCQKELRRIDESELIIAKLCVEQSIDLSYNTESNNVKMAIQKATELLQYLFVARKKEEDIDELTQLLNVIKLLTLNRWEDKPEKE
jgi:hypothetical protein